MLYFTILILIIWLLILQNKFSEISDTVSDLKRKIKELDLKISNKFEKNELVEKLNETEKPIEQQEVIENKTELTTENYYDYVEKIEAEEAIEVQNNTIDDNNQVEPDIKIDNELKENITTINTNNDINENNKNTNFESMFMGNIFNKIGAIAIFIGICFFIKIVSPYIVFTDEMKIGLSYLFSAILIGISFKIHLNEKMKTYSEVLMGTGFGVLFITTYCGTTWLSVIPPAVATIIASLTTIATYFLADKQKTNSMLAIGLIAGYMNPFFINPHINMNFLFSYLLFLNLISLIFVFRNKDKQIINLINLCVTGFTILTFHSADNTPYSVLFIIALWSLYILFDILSFKTIKFDVPLYKIQTYLNFSVLGCLSLMLFKDNLINIGFLLTCASIIYAVLGILLYKFYKKEENSYLNSFFIALYLSTFFVTSGVTRITLWSLEAFLIALISLKYQFKNLPKFSFLFLASSITNVFLNTTIYIPSNRIIFNTRLLNFLPVIVFGFLTSLCYKKLNQIKISQVLNFIAITLIYTFVLLEIYSFFSKTYNNMFYLQLVSYSIVGFIYTINLKYLYTKSNLPLFNIVSNFAYAVSIILMFMTEQYATLDTWHFLNIRLINYLFATGVSYKLYKMTNNDIFKFLSVTLAYIFATIEISKLLSDTILFTSALVYISILLIYAINLKFLKSNKEYLFETISAYCFGASLLALLVLEISSQTKITNIFNLRLITYPLIIYNFCLLKKDSRNWLKITQQDKEYEMIIEAIKYALILTVFAYIHFESVNIVNNFAYLNINWLISLMWTLYVGVISILGILKNIKCLKMSGIWLSFLVIGRIFLYDLAHMDIIVKLTLFITLGAVLMLISYFYNKYKK